MRVVTIGKSLDGIDLGGSPDEISPHHQHWTDERRVRNNDVAFVDLSDLEETVADASVLPPNDDRGPVWTPKTGDLSRELARGMDLYVFLPESREISFNDEDADEQTWDVFDWLPISVETNDDLAGPIDPQDIADGWQWYFGGDTGTDYPFHFESIRGSEEATIDHRWPLAETRYEHTIAAKIQFEGLLSYPSRNRSRVEGHVFLLPVPSDDGFGIEKVTRAILSKRHDRKIQNPMNPGPDWIRSATTETEADRRIDKLQDCRGKLRQFRPLLYEDGDDLRRAVKDGFDEIEFETSGENGWDVLIHLDDGPVPVEVTGCTGRVGKKKGVQLCDHVDKAEETNYLGDPLGGLLVINAFRRKQPKDRDRGMTDGLCNLVERRDITVLRSVRLYNLVVESLTTEYGVKLEKIDHGAMENPPETVFGESLW